MRKFTTLIICICMITVLLLPATAFAAETKYDLWVGGVQVTESNQNDVLGDGTVSYDPTTKTLTLNGANITGARSAGDSCAIYSDSSLGDLTIDLKNQNSIICPDLTTETSSYGIFIRGTLTFTGDGSLSVESADCTKGNAWSVAIFAINDIKTTNGCTITAICGYEGDYGNRSAAIYSYNGSFDPDGSNIVASKSSTGTPTVEFANRILWQYKYIKITPQVQEPTPSPIPSSSPSAAPSEPSVSPSSEPSVVPSDAPSSEPSVEPSAVPSNSPSANPTPDEDNVPETGDNFNSVLWISLMFFSVIIVSVYAVLKKHNNAGTK